MESEPCNKGIVPDGHSTKEDKGKGKGKGKGKDIMREERQPDDTRYSMLSRIGNSATGLSRDIFQGTPTATDLANVIASGKSEAPSNSLPVALGESSSAIPQPRIFGTGGFRSGEADVHTASEEYAFSDFLDNTRALIPAEPVELEYTWHEATHGSSGPDVYGQSTVTDVSSVAEQQERDGGEVVRLLWQTDDKMPEHEGYIMVSETELGSLRQALLERGLPDQLSATDWNNALNFVPDFLKEDIPDSEAKQVSMNSYMNMGVTEAAEAGSLWLEQWNRVLTSYTDEVWGDLVDLVRMARTEVDQLKEGNNVEPTHVPAVRQLRTILTRVRARL